MTFISSATPPAPASKVPEITVYFWIIKVLATTVGETAADLLSERLHLGLTWTSVVMTVAFLAALAIQFRQHRYVPPVYWLVVVLISVVGTLVSDNLVDGFGVSLVTTTILFAAALAVVFTAWYRREGTLSVHDIRTRRREGFYWAAILFTFALGTSLGDLLAERLGLGYGTAALGFAALIALVAALHYALNLNAVLSFWVAYVLTRPLGASMGDLLSKGTADGGVGLGTIGTSVLFLAVIAAVVAFLSLTRADVAPGERGVGG